jgi:hypothetical protein
MSGVIGGAVNLIKSEKAGCKAGNQSAINLFISLWQEGIKSAKKLARNLESTNPHKYKGIGNNPSLPDGVRKNNS